jgi:phage antirepressor YoqD-like protein
MDVFKNRKDLLISQKKYQEALDYVNKYDMLKDSVFSQNLSSNISVSQNIFLLRQKDNEITILSQQKELQQKKLEIQSSKIEEQQKQLEEQKSKVELANSIIGHRTNFSVKEFIDNFKIIVGKNKFLEILRNDGLLMDHPNKNHPYQQYSKYFKIQRVIKNEESREKILITPEGYVYLSKKYQNLMEKIEVNYLIES